MALDGGQVGVDGVDIVEAHEVVAEGLVGDEFQIEILGGLEGADGRVGGGVMVILGGEEFEGGDGAE